MKPEFQLRINKLLSINASTKAEATITRKYTNAKNEKPHVLIK